MFYLSMISTRQQFLNNKPSWGNRESIGFLIWIYWQINSFLHIKITCTTFIYNKMSREFFSFVWNWPSRSQWLDLEQIGNYSLTNRMVSISCCPSLWVCPSFHLLASRFSLWFSRPIPRKTKFNATIEFNHQIRNSITKHFCLCETFVGSNSANFV